MRIDVMQGRLEELDLAQILQVVGLGRQYTGVEVRRGAEVAGTIFVKSGKVVRVDAPDSGGREAFFRLFGDSVSDFSVFRMDTPGDLPEPIGALQRLLIEALATIGAKESTPPKHPTTPPSSHNWDIPTTTSAGITESRQPPVGRAKNHSTSSSPHVEGRKADAPPARAPDPAAPRAEAYAPRQAESLLPRVERGAPHDGRRSVVVAVASPKGGSGKTTTSLNLALALARQGRTVTLVDADINGDVLSSINARGRIRYGAFDLVLGRGTLDEALLKTVLPGFQIVGAVGPELPEPSLFLASQSGRWRALLEEVSARSEIVIVDTPSGMFGITHQLLSGCTHVLGVLQAEVVASRSFERFVQGIDALPPSQRPKVLGVLLNMLQIQQGPSVNVFQSACLDLPKPWLFETCIPRNPAFLLATEQGLPVRHLDELAPPAVAWLYDNLAGEIVDRLGLAPAEKRPQAFLV